MREPPTPAKRRGRKPSGQALSGAERQRRYMERLRRQASAAVSDATGIAALERDLAEARLLIERQQVLISALHRDLSAAAVTFERHERAAQREAKRLTRERDAAREALRTYREQVHQRASDATSERLDGLSEHDLLEARQRLEQQTAIIATLHVQLSEADQRLARHAQAAQAAKREAQRLAKECDATRAELARQRVSQAPPPNPELEAEFQEWLRRGRPEERRARDPAAADRSERDRRLLALHQEGLSNRAIARQLGIAESTVRSRLKTLSGKPTAQ